MALSRRALLAAGAGLLATGAATPAAIHIGFQKSGSLLVLKQRATLEQLLAPRGIDVAWHEFTSGPPLMEAIAAGSVDLGAAGDMPPLFAQAAGVEFLYVAYQPSPGRSSAILVQAAGPIRALADLTGRRVGVTRGSSAHNVLLRVLRSAGLTWRDITPVFLQPTDAMAAFLGGDLEAWAIWDPFYAIAAREPTVRVLTTAEGIAPTNSFFLARRAFAEQHPDLVAAVIAEARGVADWAHTHPEDLAQVLSRATGVALDVERIAAPRGNYETGFVTPEVVAQQQQIADSFAAIGLLPRAVRVADAVWRPSS